VVSRETPPCSAVSDAVPVIDYNVQCQPYAEGCSCLYWSAPTLTGHILVHVQTFMNCTDHEAFRKNIFVFER
jgi:hypothetical protein